jgi:teichuronic acid biosynthesis glycosyltransferase TuaC
MSATTGPVRVLTFTSLFPSEARPRHGIFVETRLQELIKSHPVDARVVAPVPWFFFRHPAFGQFASFARTPKQARRSGVDVRHPRYFMVPKVGVPFQAASMARASMRAVDAMCADGWRPELIDAHYLYPDGVAAARIARRLNVPLLLTARGTDVNVLARLPETASQIKWAASQASFVVAVSEPLKQGLLELGVEPSKLVVLRNGVALDTFRPEDKAASRLKLGLPNDPLLICIGNLVPEKGFSLAIECLVHLPDHHLLIIGEGPMGAELAAVAERCGVSSRVRFERNMPQNELRHAYSSADALLLTSSREGWPNVVLEAMACGTPVVAFDVGAVRTMLDGTNAGRVVPRRDAASLADAVVTLRAQPPLASDARRHASRFDWASIARAQFELMTTAIERSRSKLEVNER